MVVRSPNGPTPNVEDPRHDRRRRRGARRSRRENDTAAFVVADAVHHHNGGMGAWVFGKEDDPADSSADFLSFSRVMGV